MWDYNDAKGLPRFQNTTTEKVTSQHEWVKVEILAQGNRVPGGLQWRPAAWNGREADPTA